MWLRKILVLNLILLIVLTGCQVGEEIEAIRTVRLYNEKLVLALKKPEPELMKQLTSDKEYERVKMYILNLYQNKAVIDSKLYNIEIVSVKFDGKKATVKTQEEWIFKRVNPENKKSIQSGKKVFYDGKYTLEKSKEGKLVVSNLVAKEIGPRKLENMKPYR